MSGVTLYQNDPAQLNTKCMSLSETAIEAAAAHPFPNNITQHELTWWQLKVIPSIHLY